MPNAAGETPTLLASKLAWLPSNAVWVFNFLHEGPLMRDEDNEWDNAKLFEHTLSSIRRCLKLLRENGFQEKADRVQQKVAALVQLSGEACCLADVVESLGKAVASREPAYVEWRLTVVAEHLSRALAKEKQLAKELGLLFGRMLEGQAAPSHAEPERVHACAQQLHLT